MDENDGLTFPDLPRGDLDQALITLVELAGNVTETQGRLRALIRANQAVAEHLELSTVLRTIVSTAMELVDAQYCALGVLDPDGGLEEFVQVGMSESEIAAIGHAPEGLGLIGALTDEQRPIRIAHVTQDERFVGFPIGHPTMDSFLGIPITVRNEQYGNLYLANRTGGEFSEADEQLITALATTAGFAIDNARLFADSQQRQLWSAASAEITAALLSSEESDFLELLAARVLTIAAADLVCIVRETGDSEVLIIEIGRAQGDQDLDGKTFPAAGSLTASVIEGRQPRLVDDSEALDLLPTPGHTRGPAMAIPILDSGSPPGALIVSRVPGGGRFTAVDLEMAADFAGRVSVAMRLASARAARQKELLWEDRARIARDLHDHVIQQLFAAGLELHSVASALPPGPSNTRVNRAIDTLDATVSQIRTAIFALSRSHNDKQTIRHRLLDLAEELAGGLPAAPQIVFSGPVDLSLKGVIANEIVAVAREALTNVAKHAFANHVTLELKVAEDLVMIEVTDDGVGAPERFQRSGLENLRDRASQRGGTFAFDSIRGHTSLRWSVPLDGGVDEEKTKWGG